MDCHATSNSDFDKGGCIIQVEWTKALCNTYQPHALNYSVQKVREDISCVWNLNGKVV